MERIEFVFSFGSVDAADIWKAIELVLSQNGLAQNTATFYGREYEFSSIISEIDRQNKKAFNIEMRNLSFLFSSIIKYRQCLLQITVKEEISRDWWLLWVDSLVSIGGFTQAWLVDVEFDFWQNAEDPIEYKAKEKSLTGLPMISNGLPPPLEQHVIDVSKNLGRRKVCDQYVEAIGSYMWVTSKFFELIGRNKEDIESSSDISIEGVGGDVHCISVGTDLFRDSTTEVLQRALRDSLYPKEL